MNQLAVRDAASAEDVHFVLVKESVLDFGRSYRTASPSDAVVRRALDRFDPALTDFSGRAAAALEIAMANPTLWSRLRQELQSAGRLKRKRDEQVIAAVRREEAARDAQRARDRHARRQTVADVHRRAALLNMQYQEADAAAVGVGPGVGAAALEDSDGNGEADTAADAEEADAAAAEEADAAADAEEADAAAAEADAAAPGESDV